MTTLGTPAVNAQTLFIRGDENEYGCNGAIAA
jgi:hypothetical protein